MLYLSEEAMDYAMAMCKRNRGYRVVIVTSSEQRKEFILHYIGGSRDWNPQRRMIHYYHPQYAELDNGSVIDIVSASENARGRRAHLVIVDDEVSDELINSVFRPIEILEQVERRQRRYEYEEFDINRLWAAHANTRWTITIPSDDEEEPETEDENESIVSEDELMKVLGVA